jgi:predicted RNase H-like HicB family nuclease
MCRYEILIFWSDADQVYIAEIPELPGCLAHGETAEQALANAQQAIELWVATAIEFGDAVPQPKGRRLMYA